MALNAATIWEVRTSGSNNNGGGWHDTGGSSTDYSQQDAAQLSLNDVVTDGTTTVTSATGGFTDAMVGNVINILTKGRFEITARTDTNTITVDRTATAGSGLTANVGGAVADLEQIDNIIVAGNTVHTKAGTYTLAGAISTTAGATNLPIKIIGYNSVRGDNPTGDNRPLFACGANAFTLGNATWFHNFRATTTHADGISVGGYNSVVNCKCVNTSSGNAFLLGTGYAALVDCEAKSTTSGGIAVSIAAAGCTLFGCFIYDSPIGIQTTSNGLSVLFSIIDTCATYGIHFSGASAQYGVLVANCVLYDCGTGIRSDTGGNRNVMMNNIIAECTTGISCSSAPAAYLDYNNFYNNGTDVSGVNKGPNDTAVNPQFTNPAGNDFSLQAGSPCIGAGFATRLGVG